MDIICFAQRGVNLFHHFQRTSKFNNRGEKGRWFVFWGTRICQHWPVRLGNCWLVGEGCPVPCRMLSSSPGLFPVDMKSTPLPQLWGLKMSAGICHLGGEIVPRWNCWLTHRKTCTWRHRWMGVAVSQSDYYKNRQVGWTWPMAIVGQSLP